MELQLLLRVISIETALSMLRLVGLGMRPRGELLGLYSSIREELGA